MKNRFIGFLLAGVICTSFISCPASAEDKFTFSTDTYNNNLYIPAKLDGEVKIQNDGKVIFTIYKKNCEYGYMIELPKITISDSACTVYTYDYGWRNTKDDTTYSFSMTSNEFNTKNYYIKTFTPRVNSIYVDEKGNLFYKENGEKHYFSTTITVKIDGNTFTKEIGNGETVQTSNKPAIFGDINGDINGDGLINANDATWILRYSAYIGTGGTKSLSDFVKEN